MVDATGDSRVVYFNVFEDASRPIMSQGCRHLPWGEKLPTDRAWLTRWKLPQSGIHPFSPGIVLLYFIFTAR